MSDLIERKSIRNLYSCLDPKDKVRVAQVLIDIDAIPTIDAVEVVRCRECKKWFEYKGINFCYRTRYTAKADDFCSRGERKERE